MPLTVDRAFSLLESAHGRDHLSHALLLHGPKGAGKRELVARLVRHLRVEQPPDNAEMGLWGDEVHPQEAGRAEEEAVANVHDLADEFTHIIQPRSLSRIIRIDEVRELEHHLHLTAPPGRWKVGILKDADRLNESAANAFLKTLEEPPEQCLLILLTEYPGRLLPTIRSRCLNLALYCPQPEPLELPSSIVQALHHLPGAKHRIAGIMMLKACVEAHLQQLKEEIRSGHLAALSHDKAESRGAGDPKWLERQEDMAKAATEADYRAARSELIGSLLSFLADAVRAKLGLSHRDLPLLQRESALFAQDTPLLVLLNRLDALEELASVLETNVQEPLALEAQLLKAFGPA